MWSLVCLGVSAQSRTQLEDERNRIIQQIEETSQNLEKTSNNKKATLKDLRAVENQIKNRKKLIKNIQAQIKNADQEIAQNSGRIDGLNQDLSLTNDQYNQLARNMYLRHLAGNKWAYILSSDSVNDFFLRWRYTKQYEQFTSQKTTDVNTLKSNLSEKTQEIKVEKSNVEKLLAAEKSNFKKLEKDQKKKDDILKKLKSEENSLKLALKKKKSQREKLNLEIEKIILSELSKTTKDYEEVTADISKKKLAWPAKGYISGKFGSQPHPTIKNVKINNNGVDITCKRSATVSAVAGGKVISITNIPGYDTMVIVQHGKYYSVYSKLAHIIVKKDEKLQAGQTIGRLADTDAPELHFEFWKEKEKLNPADWIR